MLQKSKGIVFRTVKYRDTSLILDIYLRELGIRTLVINGVRRKNARIPASILQPMSLLELDVYEQEQREINRIREVQPAYVYQRIPFDIARSSVGLFILEMARKSIREKEANPGLFDFLEDRFMHLDQTDEKIALFHLYFLLDLSEKLGFHPESDLGDGDGFFDLREGNFSSPAPMHPDFLGKELSRALYRLLIKEDGFYPPPRLREELLDQLVRYYQIHLGDFGPVKSLEVFRDIFRA